jgi:hypothetical protein
MKKLAYRSFCLLAGLGLSVAGGRYLAHAIIDCLCAAPFFLEMSIREALILTGNNKLNNPSILKPLNCCGLW